VEAPVTLQLLMETAARKNQAATVRRSVTPTTRPY
jgi:hypothetical protein